MGVVRVSLLIVLITFADNYEDKIACSVLRSNPGYSKCLSHAISNWAAEAFGIGAEDAHILRLSGLILRLAMQ